MLCGSSIASTTIWARFPCFPSLSSFSPRPFASGWTCSGLSRCSSALATPSCSTFCNLLSYPPFPSPSPPDVFDHISQANRHFYLCHRCFSSLWLIPRPSFTSFSSSSAGISTLIMAASSMSSPRYSPTPAPCPPPHRHHHLASASSDPLKSSSGASL